MTNTISIDEKPIIISKLKQKSVRIPKNHRGKVPSNTIKTFKLLDNLNNLYLLCAITFNGVFLYHLSDSPITTAKYNAFLLKLISLINFENQGRFVLIDNASFHSIDELVKNAMRSQNWQLQELLQYDAFLTPLKSFLPISIIF